MAELFYHKAHFAAAEIAQLPGYSLPIDGTFFQEFVVQCPVSPSEINRKLMNKNILGGLDLTVPPYEGRYASGEVNPMLLCVNETNTRQDIDALVSALSEFR